MGLFTPYDGHIDPYSLTQAVAKGARNYGAQILQGTEVTSLTLRDDSRWVVGTSRGDILANNVVNAAGFWAKDVGRLCGLDLPLVPIQHQYLVSSSVPEVQALKSEFPVLRLLEASCYVRQERDGILVGVYESKDEMKLNKEWSIDGVPREFGKELFDSDLERITPHLEQVMDVIPAFASANIQSIVNGPITYTPDILPMIGPSVLPNMWLAVGFGYGIIHGGGVGKFLADWIQQGEPGYDLIECDPGRFSTWTSDEYVFAKARESYGMNNALAYPHEERFAGRPTRRITSAYEKQKARGANMVIDAGWEHPSWFAKPGEKPQYIPDFGRQNWHANVEREYSDATKGVGVLDLSPFGKFMVEGPQAEAFVEYITANKVPALGRSVVTHLLSHTGNVYAELTATRLESQKFMLVTGSGSEIHDLRWMKEVARNGKFDVKFDNVSDTMGCLSVIGPQSKKLLSKLHSRFEEKFPFFTFASINIKGIECLAMRLTYSGELGWEIYLPIEKTGDLYDSILKAGEEFEDFADVGSYALNVLRLEKGFRLWGKEMNMNTNAVDAGLLPFINMKKKDFIGKKSIENILTQHQKRELVMVKISSECPYDPQGDESIWVDNKVVGNVTSGCFSCYLQQPIAFAYLPPYMTSFGSQVQVEMMTNLYDCEVLKRPPQLTHNEKIAAKKLNKSR